MCYTDSTLWTENFSCFRAITVKIFATEVLILADQNLSIITTAYVGR